jgi:hypothetical protein
MVFDRVVARLLPPFRITTTFGCLFSVAVAIAASILVYLKVEKPTLSYLTKRFCKRPIPSRALPTTAVPIAIVTMEPVPEYTANGLAD